MPKTVLYHPLFRTDVYEAVDWYYQQSPGLGAILLSYVEARLRDIIQQPERFAQHAIGCRYAKVSKFPYILLFKCGDEFVDKLGLAHVSRSDEKWRERLN